MSEMDAEQRRKWLLSVAKQKKDIYIEFAQAKKILLSMPQQDRYGWLRPNMERLVRNLSRHKRKQLLACAYEGLTKKQLREQGCNLKPRTIRLRVAAG